MTNTQLLFLASAIYTAPHLSSSMALVLALLGTVAGLYFAMKDRN